MSVKVNLPLIIASACTNMWNLAALKRNMFFETCVLKETVYFKINHRRPYLCGSIFTIFSWSGSSGKIHRAKEKFTGIRLSNVLNIT